MHWNTDLITLLLLFHKELAALRSIARYQGPCLLTYGLAFALVGAASVGLCLSMILNIGFIGYIDSKKQL